MVHAHWPGVEAGWWLSAHALHLLRAWALVSDCLGLNSDLLLAYLLCLLVMPPNPFVPLVFVSFIWNLPVRLS